MRCPICGKELSSLDRQNHMKTKHHEYFYESRKWVTVSYLAIFLNLIFFITFFSLNAENSTYAVSIILVLMALDAAIAIFIIRKLKGLVSKYAASSGNEGKAPDAKTKRRPLGKQSDSAQ